MRENFEPALRVVSETVKENPALEDAVDRLDENLKKQTDEEGNPLGLEEMIPEAARIDILELQKEKRAIMKWMHERFHDIEEGKGIESFEHVGKRYTLDKDLHSKGGGDVTLGEILTDSDWGVEYRLLPEVSRQIKKKYVVAEAKHHLRKLLDKQIAITEISRKVPTDMDREMKGVMSGAKIGYRQLLNQEKRHINKLENGPSSGGFIAETISPYGNGGITDQSQTPLFRATSGHF